MMMVRVDPRVEPAAGAGVTRPQNLADSGATRHVHDGPKIHAHDEAEAEAAQTPINAHCGLHSVRDDRDRARHCVRARSRCSTVIASPAGRLAAAEGGPRSRLDSWERECACLEA